MNGKSCIDLMECAAACSRVLDLTHTLEPGMPAWPTQARYGSVIYESYDWGDGALHSMITMSEHTGTHIDAPKHFIRGGCPVDELPPSSIMGRGVNVNAVFVEPRGLFGLEQLKDFEAGQGEIRKGDIVMFRFGWDSKYRLAPDAAEYLRDWPGLAPDAAEYLAGRRVAAVGCDTLALDPYGSDNPCHPILLGENIPILENIDNLSKLPVFSYVIGLPNKFKGGSGSPIRLIAFVDQAGERLE
jgi:kynurenine formamidase